MSLLPDSVRLNDRLVIRSAALMYASAAAVSLVEGAFPGGPPFSFAPGLAAAAVAAVLVLVGHRLPRWMLAQFGPLGTALIAYAVATTTAPADNAALYMWPVLWTTFFFGRKGAVAIVAWTGLAHAVALASLPAEIGYPDRWIDLMASVCVVAAVVDVLGGLNDALVSRLAAEARTDELTGLLNRRGFEEHSAAELARARRDDTFVGVASFDIDYFKRVNDEWGHETGDRVLVRLASILTAESREIDLVARLGGEEFVVLLPRCDVAAAERFAERIRIAVAAEDDSELPGIRVSAGVAADRAPSTMNVLLQQADSALYTAKRTGRNRTRVYRDATRPLVAVAASGA